MATDEGSKEVKDDTGGGQCGDTVGKAHFEQKQSIIFVWKLPILSVCNKMPCDYPKLKSMLQETFL